MIQLRPWLLILFALCGLTACGQKGPLYLPQDDPATHSTEAQS